MARGLKANYHLHYDDDVNHDLIDSWDQIISEKLKIEIEKFITGMDKEIRAC